MSCVSNTNAQSVDVPLEAGGFSVHAEADEARGCLFVDDVFWLVGWFGLCLAACCDSVIHYGSNAMNQNTHCDIETMLDVNCICFFSVKNTFRNE